MTKILRNIIFPSIFAGSLLFSGCGIKDIPKEATNAIIGEEDAWNKAQDAVKNPGKYARESITGKVIEAEKKSGITKRVVEEPQTIEDYFLQGKELEGITLAPESYGFGYFSQDKYFNGKNPFIFKGKEKIKGLNPNSIGVAFYLLPKKDEDTEIWNGAEEAELFIRVQTDKACYDNLVHELHPGMYKSGAFDYNIAFLKNDISDSDGLRCEYNTYIGITIQGITTKEQAITYINCLKNYQKRIGAELILRNYPGGKDEWFGENFILWSERMEKAINNPSDYDFNSSEEVIREMTRMDNWSY